MAQAKSIKGITIEIAGDTTKLSKALAGVDATSKELASSLKKVDKLLDMDPGNTDLLAQKQEILADAISGTTDRLETLRDVQDQITQQYRNGDIGRTAYLDFRAEVMRTEKKLDDLRDESRNVERALQGAGDEARDTAGDFEQLKGSASGAVTAFEDNGEGWGKLASAGLKGFAGAAVAVGTALIGSVEATEEYREEMAKLDVSFSTAKLSAEAADEAYRILYRTIGETDQSVEAAQQIALLADSTEDVVAWASLAPGVVARFGDALQPETFYESANETLKLGEATGAYVQMLEGAGYSVDVFNQHLSVASTEEQRQAYMLRVTNAILGEAAKEYEEMNATVMEARDADAKLTESMGKLGDAFSPVVTGAKEIGSTIIDAMVPAVEYGIDAFSDIAENASENWELVKDGFSMLGEGCVEIGEDIATAFADFTDRSKQRIDDFGSAWGDFGVLMKEGASGIAADIKEGFGEAIDKVKGMLDFDWEWPKIKLPHFSITGEFAWGPPPKVPKIGVSWYAQGGILTGATIFGALGGTLLGGGEAGHEAVLPLDSFYRNLEDILTRRDSGYSQLIVNVEIGHFENASEQDPRDFANAVMDELNVRLQQKGAAF